MAVYGLTKDTVRGFNNNPLDFAPKVARPGIPILVVMGDMDSVVPLYENSFILKII